MVDLAPRSDRARGRELALLALCHLESYGHEERTEALGLLWNNPPCDPECDLASLIATVPVRAFAERLLAHLKPRMEELDAVIDSVSMSWRLERMDRIDRNLLRLAAAELAHDLETPRAVVLAEAVRLAARYGSDRSARFVNGLVEALAQRLRPERAANEGAGTVERTTGVRIRVDPLDRSLLEGVDDGGDGVRVRLDLGLLPFFVDERPLLGLAAFIDWRTSGRLSMLVRDGVCRGAAGERLLLPGKTTLPVDRLVLVGLGVSREFDRERARDMAHEMVGIARGLRATRVLMAMPGGLQERSLSETAFVALAEAVRESPGAAGERRSEIGEERAACAVQKDAQAEVAGSEETAPATEETLDGPADRWWVVAEPRHVSRMRRLLEGPPRPADPG